MDARNESAAAFPTSEVEKGNYSNIETVGGRHPLCFASEYTPGRACIGRCYRAPYPLVEIHVPDHSTISRPATLAAPASANVSVIGPHEAGRR